MTHRERKMVENVLDCACVRLRSEIHIEWAMCERDKRVDFDLFRYGYANYAS